MYITKLDQFKKVYDIIYNSLTECFTEKELYSIQVFLENDTTRFLKLDIEFDRNIPVDKIKKIKKSFNQLDYKGESIKKWKTQIQSYTLHYYIGIY